MELLLGISVLFTIVSVSVCKQISITCTESEYYDEESEICSTCSMCPLDNIVLQPCTANQDTVCGPWTDFDGSINLPKEPFPSEVPVVDIPEGGIGKGGEPMELLTDEWYRISMVLLGILCFMSLCIALYIILACFICKKKKEDKEILYQPDFIDNRSSTSEEPRYVEYFISSRDRLRRHSQIMSRLYANDVNRLSPISPLLPPNTSIYMNTMDIIPENTPQEIDSDGYVCIDSKY